MKVQINSPDDMRPNDKWLDMEVTNTVEGCPVFGGDDAPWPRWCVSLLIDAGNDEVERGPEIVEFEGYVRENAPHHKKVNVATLTLAHTDKKLQFAPGSEVHVAVSKDRFSCIPGEVVASGTYRVDNDWQSIGDRRIPAWLNEHAEPNDQITITRRKP